MTEEPQLDHILEDDDQPATKGDMRRALQKLSEFRREQASMMDILKSIHRQLNDGSQIPRKFQRMRNRPDRSRSAKNLPANKSS